ncbi:MAG: type II toxin-antitoxin system HicB family antitoxin [Gemmataceae bacterium]|nr:type II toxin-antitoxin system HicB family antitoxin [Gemmataceae bacterium]
MMKYKGYTGRITAVDEDQGVLHGKVAGITDTVTFEGTTLQEVVQAFHDSVDDYLAFCEERGDAAEKPCSGKFLVRVSPDLHRRLALAAKQANQSLNAFVAAALEDSLANSASKNKRKERLGNSSRQNSKGKRGKKKKRSPH